MLAFFAVRTGGRGIAIASVTVALVVDLSGIASFGGGFVYAIVVAPLLALALFSLRSRGGARR